jgi:hypothetical protein
MTKTNRKTRILAAAAVVAASFATGLVGGAAAQLSKASEPAACHVAGRPLPSGDVIKVDGRGNAWTADSTVKGPLQEYVCTDGTWVHVR